MGSVTPGQIKPDSCELSLYRGWYVPGMNTSHRLTTSNQCRFNTFIDPLIASHNLFLSSDVLKNHSFYCYIKYPWF